MTFRLPHFAGAVLLAAAPFAGAETPMTDPVAPAVIGRPLDQTGPARPVRKKPTVAKPNRPKQVAASKRAVPDRPAVRVAAAPAAVQAAPVTQQMPNAPVADNAGNGMRIARRPFGPGSYFSSRDQELVRRYYEARPVSGRPATWKIGEPVPARATLKGVPDDVRAALPVLPPGHQYVQLDGDVVLVAVHTRTVVDGVSRGVR